MASNIAPAQLPTIRRQSVRISWILRHGKQFSQHIDSQGFMLVDKLLELIPKLTLRDVQDIVRDDRKGRYEMRQQQNDGTLGDGDGDRPVKWLIRANQGHSLQHIQIDNQLITNTGDYPLVIHGTYCQNIQSILDNGLNRCNRQHIHMAQGFDARSGSRYDCTAFIIIDMQRAIEHGQLKFYVSSNGVILSEGDTQRGGIIDKQYFKDILDVQRKSIVSRFKNFSPQ
ncbi:tRNA 2'-phosphotransferase 1-like [Oppia nitens]|uniref:tRNA 2'-phosphotransferase 1-like n=1 Tax=Oppia nitens TaxID=1686743 RepID=UPI0023DC10A0|nr:tRNA 2'-phosphotransferase 1-like [Oppia nitens]